MRETTPKVRLIASPAVRWAAVQEHLEDVGGGEWLQRVLGDSGSRDAELLVEYAGRRCYRSWAPGLNANVTKVREDSGEYLTNILRSKHGAVLEHAQFTFDFDQVSRVFTHELVRHRAGVAISQESLRYVRLTDIGFRIPEVLDRNDLTVPHYVEGDGGWEQRSFREELISIVEHLEEFQRSAAEAFGLDDEGVPFHVKKEITSALRRLAPIGLSTGMVWSANARTLRHVIDLRTAVGAEEEIRLVFDRVARIMQREFPLLFGDFKPYDSSGMFVHTISPNGVYHWRPEFEKV